MAVWRKVIVSGSTANLAAAQVDNLTSGYAVIGGGQASNLSSRAVSGSGAILADGASGITLSGSFSGSFRGDGSGLTGVTAQSAFSLTFGEGIGSLGPSVSSSYNGNQPVTIVVSGAVDLTEGRHIRWDNTANKVANSLIFDDGTNVQITGSSVIVSGASTAFIVTGSVRSTGGFTGSLFGTSSWASNATTAQTASFVNNLNQNVVITGSLVVSGSSLTELFVLGDEQITGSLRITNGIVAQTITGSLTGSLTGALIGTASFASTATQVVNSLTPGLGISGSAYNGSTAQIFYLSGSNNLTADRVTKWTGAGLSNTNISDSATQVQILAGASSGLSVAAGGISVTGNSTFANNVRITGDLNVAGTASFENTQNLLIGDRFIALASGSTSNTDGGIIVVSSTAGGGMSGSAWYLETGTGTNFGQYGRWASAFNVHVSASGINVTSSEYAVTVNVAASSNPSAAPVWGGSANGSGNMWINDSTGDIFIYS